MPVLRPSGSDFTSFVKAAAQYVPSGRAGKTSKSGGVSVALPGLGAIVRTSQVGALASPTTSAVVINGITPPPRGPSGPVVFIPPANTGTLSTLVSGLSTFPNGIMYIPTTGNLVVSHARYSINVMTPAGVITMLAGISASAGSVDGVGTDARFNNPRQPCVIPTTGVIIVPEQNNIRTVTTTTWAVNSGIASTLAGVSGTSGLLDGQGTAARFSGPQCVAFDPNTNRILVADSGNNAIRTITYPGGNVTTLATGFNNPQSVVYNQTTGNYVIADYGSHRILGLTPAGTTSVIAGTGTYGSGNGAAASATFAFPLSVAVDPSGNILVLDSSGIRSISTAGVVSTLVTTAFGGSPTHITVDPTNNNIFVTDLFAQTIYKVV